MGGTTKFDILVLSMAIVTLTIWKVSNNPVLGLVMSIVANFIAFWPTIIKAWHLPGTEEWRIYAFYVLSSIFTILSISNFTFGKVVSPVYVIFMNGFLTLMIVLRKKILKNNKI
jgi:hypothetical protein